MALFKKSNSEKDEQEDLSPVVKKEAPKKEATKKAAKKETVKKETKKVDKKAEDAAAEAERIRMRNLGYF